MKHDRLVNICICIIATVYLLVRHYVACLLDQGSPLGMSKDDPLQSQVCQYVCAARGKEKLRSIE